MGVSYEIVGAKWVSRHREDPWKNGEPLLTGGSGDIRSAWFEHRARKSDGEKAAEDGRDRTTPALVSHFEGSGFYLTPTGGLCRALNP